MYTELHTNSIIYMSCCVRVRECGCVCMLFLVKSISMCLCTGHVSSTKHHRCLTVGIICLMVVLSVVLVVCVAMPIKLVSSDAKNPTTKLGHRNDTNCLLELNRFSHSEVSVSRCDQVGDSAHVNEIYLIKKDDVTTHERTDKFQSVTIDQISSLSITGIVNYLYLLPDSVIEYTLCIGSKQDQQLEGKLFIFDYDEKFSMYQNSPELGEQLSVFSMELVIGRSNQMNCMTVRYQVPKAAYHFVASRTPAGIFYTFNYTNSVLYYRHEDYSIGCTIDSTPCSMPIPGHLFSSEEYVLLSYTVPNEETTSVQTHLCVTTNRSDTVTFIVALYGSVAGISAIALSFIIFVQCVIWYRGRNRKGYVTIDSMPRYMYY